MENISNYFKILIIILVLCIFVIFLEILARLIFSTSLQARRERNASADKIYYLPYVGYFHKPFSEVRPNLWTDKHGFILNNSEYRDLHIKGRQEMRIFILGGSTVAGSFLRSLDKSIAALVEQELNKFLKDNNFNFNVIVINAGVGGYQSCQEFALLKWYILPLNPDYVIYFDGSNDFSNYVEEQGIVNNLLVQDVNPYHWKLFKNYNNIFRLSDIFRYFVNNYSNYSAILHGIQELKYRLHLIPEQPQKKEDKNEINAYINLHLERYKTNIISAIGLCNKFNINIAYLLQPTLLRDTPHKTTEEISVINNVKQLWHGYDYLDCKKDFYQQASRLFEVLKRKYKNDAIIEDLSQILTLDNNSNNISFYGDHVHYRENANIIIAKAICEKIKISVLDLASRRSSPHNHN